jgi:hypothetical protein
MGKGVKRAEENRIDHSQAAEGFQGAGGYIVIGKNSYGRLLSGE